MINKNKESIFEQAVILLKECRYKLNESLFSKEKDKYLDQEEKFYAKTLDKYCKLFMSDFERINKK